MGLGISHYRRRGVGELCYGAPIMSLRMKSDIKSDHFRNQITSANKTFSDIILRVCPLMVWFVENNGIFFFTRNDSSLMYRSLNDKLTICIAKHMLDSYKRGLLVSNHRLYTRLASYLSTNHPLPPPKKSVPSSLTEEWKKVRCEKSCMNHCPVLQQL